MKRLDQRPRQLAKQRKVRGGDGRRALRGSEARRGRDARTASAQIALRRGDRRRGLARGAAAGPARRPARPRLDLGARGRRRGAPPARDRRRHHRPRDGDGVPRARQRGDGGRAAARAASPGADPDLVRPLAAPDRSSATPGIHLQTKVARCAPSRERPARLASRAPKAPADGGLRPRARRGGPAAERRSDRRRGRGRARRRARLRPRRRAAAHQRPAHLRDRRPVRAADARAQGDARGRRSPPR